VNEKEDDVSVMKKLLPLIPLLILVLVAGAIFAPDSVVSQAGDDPGFKNVQVLTDLSREELEDYMAEITEHIGAEKCTFCHVRDKSSDENEHKVVAREYMKLVKELNEGFFKEKEHKVTCFTCHQGQKEPKNHPDA
jgi:hypothetical protein